jgi:predicted nucleic acid-binding protein
MTQHETASAASSTSQQNLHRRAALGDAVGLAKRSMSDKAFLDTNVLVYAVDDADPVKRDRARELLAEAASGELVLSTQVLSEFYAVVTRKLAVPMTEAAAAEAVNQLALLPLVETDAALVKSGIAASRQAHLSFWDGMIVAAAVVAGCTRLLTEDLNDGALIQTVRIENPFTSPR